MFIGLVVLGGFNFAVGTTETCDLQGPITGTVTDVAIFPVFTGWNVNLSTVNCHDTTISDSFSAWWRSVTSGIFGGALIQVGGPYHIQVKVYDDNYKLLGSSECFSFTTNVGEVTKSFSFNAHISNLEKGQNVIVNAYNECKADAGIQATFSKTV